MNREYWLLCDWCGEAFTRKLKNIHREHSFCSKDCRNAWHSKHMKELNKEIWRGNEKRCPKCGKYKPLSEYYKESTAPSGIYTYCIECTKEKNKGRKRKMTHSIRETYGIYKRNAKKRNIEWNLTRDELATLIYADCYYCKKFPNDINGIDRVDSSKGYVWDNCVPCCSNCNYLKNNSTIDEFATWITNIYPWAKKYKEEN